MAHLLSIGYKISEFEEIIKIEDFGDAWQIVKTNYNNALILTQEVAEFNIAKHILDKDLFDIKPVDSKLVYIIRSETRYILEHLRKSRVPKSYNEALSFSLSLYSTRNIIDGIDLIDSIFIEKYSKLLVLDLEQKSIKKNDDILLSKWLTGGGNVSLENSDRISQLSGITDKKNIDQLVSASGIVIDDFEKQINIKKSNFRLPGRSEITKFINEHVIDILENPDVYQTMGVSFPSPFILYGPPGCGKTYAVDLLSKYLNYPSFKIDSSSIASPYIHDTSKKIAEVFNAAIKNSPSIIIIDEMESYMSSRSSHNSGQHNIEEVNEFLRLIPNAMENKVLVIGMTNELDMIDPAIKRKGRFDHSLEIGLPTKDEIKDLLLYLLSKRPHNIDENIDEISILLSERTLSDIQFVVDQSARLAARNRELEIKLTHIMEVIKDLQPLEKKHKNSIIGFIN